MKIRVVSSRGEIFKLDPNERIIHLAFRPSNKDIFGLVETCPKIELLQLPQSYRRTVSKSVETFLEMQRVQIAEGDVWGHRKDLNEYYDIPPLVIEKIKAMKNEGVSTEEIGKKISKESRLNPQIVADILSKDIFA